MKVVLIDDEIKSVEMLQMELEKLFPNEMEILAFTVVEEGIHSLVTYDPDLVFLDINMPGKNGFEVLEEVGAYSFQVVFATAYSDYAIQAFRSNACDYLLKPFDTEEIKDAVLKAKTKIKQSKAAEMTEMLLKLTPKQKKKIHIPTAKGISFLSVAEIIYCQSESNYTHIITTQDKLFVSKTLKHISNLLPHDQFLRVHNSVLVNTQHVKEYIKADGGSLLMSNGDQVKISNNKKGMLDQVF